uniref:Uncharacterized protein n=1 Tax=Anguilla anguilla TaxID=7936 RepID=A0A0E9PY67_ANGAN
MSFFLFEQAYLRCVSSQYRPRTKSIHSLCDQIFVILIINYLSCNSDVDIELRNNLSSFIMSHYARNEAEHGKMY